VRYIHLNPIRADFIKNLDELGNYPFCGHSVVVGKATNPWQDTQEVLRMFGDKSGAARRAYRSFVEKVIAEGKRYDLTGGGMIRSAVRWEGVKARREKKVYQICYWTARELRVSMTTLAKRMGISVAAISGPVVRGQRISEEKVLKLS
jgi:hypothetical protein